MVMVMAMVKLYTVPDTWNCLVWFIYIQQKNGINFQNYFNGEGDEGNQVKMNAPDLIQS